MENDVTAERSYREVLEELARSRGFGGAEELARRVVDLDPSYDVREILEAPAYGYGTALDRVLHMNDEEKTMLVRAFAAEFMSPSRLKRVGDGAPGTTGDIFGCGRPNPPAA